MLPVIIIIGPTAVGKSAMAIELAQLVNGEIISGDSVQIYRKLDIGSAKPTIEERQGIPHHLIDCLDPDEPFTVACFQKLTKELINSIKARNHIPIIVGGTGLYIRSITDDFVFPQEGSQKIKQKWLNYAKQFGTKKLHEILARYDPESAQRLHYNDTSRIIRALEVYELTGIPLSSQRSYKEKEYLPLDKSIIYIGLSAPREVIYERINQRCDNMIKQGLIEETKKLLEEGYSPNVKSLQSIGYKHAVYYLQGKATLPEMIRLFKRDTRRFAKRQLTWFRRDPRIKWYDITVNSPQEILNHIVNTCREIQTRVE